MKQELKDKWIIALTDGSHKQGRLRLKINDQFCCLGVLADVVDPTWVERDRVTGMGWRNDQCVSSFGPDTLEELGPKDGDQAFLIGMNDAMQIPFADIAAWIKDNIEAE